MVDSQQPVILLGLQPQAGLVRLGICVVLCNRTSRVVDSQQPVILPGLQPLAGLARQGMRPSVQQNISGG